MVYYSKCFGSFFVCARGEFHGKRNDEKEKIRKARRNTKTIINNFYLFSKQEELKFLCYALLFIF